MTDTTGDLFDLGPVTDADIRAAGADIELSIQAGRCRSVLYFLCSSDATKREKGMLDDAIGRRMGNAGLATMAHDESPGQRWSSWYLTRAGLDAMTTRGINLPRRIA